MLEMPEDPVSAGLTSIVLLPIRYVGVYANSINLHSACQ